MKKYFICFMSLFISPCLADVLDLNIALQNTYRACVNIDENLYELKVLAGVNTAVTAVGTGLGVGATVTGFVKEDTDKNIEKFESYIKQLEEAASKQTQRPTRVNITDAQIHDLFVDSGNLQEKQTELAKMNEQSKNLGNWRTGLLAGNTATNIAGAIISSQTINKDDIQGQIDKCISATRDLNESIIVAKMNGENVDEAQNIYNACREYEYVDITSINKRGKGAMISASIGAGLGGVGTITSGVANSDKIRNDNSDAGKKKEKDLNTASNVLAVGATAASATATVFNATQISAIKKVANVSQSCTGVLK